MCSCRLCYYVEHNSTNFVLLKCEKALEDDYWWFPNISGYINRHQEFFLHFQLIVCLFCRMVWNCALNYLMCLQIWSLRKVLASRNCWGLVRLTVVGWKSRSPQARDVRSLFQNQMDCWSSLEAMIWHENEGLFNFFIYCRSNCICRTLPCSWFKIGIA